MKRCKHALAFAAGLVAVSAVPLSAGGAAYQAAVNADAARRVAMVRAQDLQGDAKSGGLNFLPPAEDRGVPTYRKLPDVERVPDNLASNASR